MKKKFLDIYGHLRPNTYEINSLNYKDGYKFYFNKQKKVKNFNPKKKIFNFTLIQKRKIELFLNKNFTNFSFSKILDFIKKSIIYREYGKFVFTKSIDLIFIELRKIAKKQKIKIKDLSYLEIDKVLNLYYNLNNDKISEKFLENIKINKTNYNYNQNIRFPDTIINLKDIYTFSEKENTINFVGNKSCISKIKILNKTNNIFNLKNKIVCIESADPGYDFIFDQNISGLITKFGGKNSHMAIRCSELNIPAAIGVGNNYFEKLKSNTIVEINCETNKLNFIN